MPSDIFYHLTDTASSRSWPDLRINWLAREFGPILRVVAGGAHMKELTRITTDPHVMGGKLVYRK